MNIRQDFLDNYSVTLISITFKAWRQSWRPRNRSRMPTPSFTWETRSLRTISLQQEAFPGKGPFPYCSKARLYIWYCIYYVYYHGLLIIIQFGWPLICSGTRRPPGIWPPVDSTLATSTPSAPGGAMTLLWPGQYFYPCILSLSIYLIYLSILSLSWYLAFRGLNPQNYNFFGSMKVMPLLWPDTYLSICYG